MVLLLERRDPASLCRTLECRLLPDNKHRLEEIFEERISFKFCVSPGQEGLVVLDGVQFIRGRVAALARKLLLGVVGPRAVRDVNVTAAEVAAAFEGRRGGRDAVYDDTRRKKVGVLRERKERTRSEIPGLAPASSSLA